VRPSCGLLREARRPDEEKENGMSDRSTHSMRTYWDDRARLNAAWYVDTTVDYDRPDMDRFFEDGKGIVRDALDGAPAQPPSRELAVEVGSGLGRICLALASRFDRVIGLDISPEMTTQARQLVSDPRVQFEVGDGATLQCVEDASTDLVLSFTVFQHIPKVSIIEGYLREARRVLRPGGLLVFQWNSTMGTRRWAARRLVYSTLQNIGLRGGTRGRDASEFLGSCVPVARMEQVLSSSGLRLIETRGEGTLFTWGWATRQ
jgi:SAM-dependent methyltransferase